MVDTELGLLADVVAKAIDTATAPLLARIAVLEKRAVTHGRDGRDAVAPDLDAIALQAAALIPRPADGKDGRDAPAPDLDYIAAKAAALIPKPADGRDASLPDLDYIATKAAALIPRPADGRDGKDAPAFNVAAEVSGALEAYVQKHILPLMQKFEQMPAPKPGEPGPKGDTGRDGRDGTSVEYSAVESMVSVAVERAVAAIPAPKHGRDGIDGTSIDVSAVKAMVVDAVAAIPAPKDGRDGKDGRDIDPAALEVIVSGYVEKAVGALPKPQDGASVTVEDVAPLVSAEVTKAVAALPKAIDGVGVADAIIDRAGELVLTFSDGRTKSVGPVVGANADPADTARVIAEQIAAFPRPEDGQDGKDGLGFDDLDVVDDGEKCLLRFARDGHVKEFTVPIPVDRGVYKPGVRYRKGAMVTAQGALWTAQADTAERPGDGSTSWRLAVKKGRDGRDFVPPTEGGQR